MKTTLVNGLFAKFLGWELNTLGNEKYCITPFNKPLNSSNKYTLEQMEFSTNWNWLMLVVNKIESLGYRIEIVRHICRIYLSDDQTIIISEDIPKIESTYNACISFVKWFNNTCI